MNVPSTSSSRQIVSGLVFTPPAHQQTSPSGNLEQADFAIVKQCALSQVPVSLVRSTAYKVYDFSFTVVQWLLYAAVNDGLDGQTVQLYAASLTTLDAFSPVAGDMHQWGVPDHVLLSCDAEDVLLQQQDGQVDTASSDRLGMLMKRFQAKGGTR
ncbi:hypothetical protein RI367_007005 [Sorochytrium milnesiophthora]